MRHKATDCPTNEFIYLSTYLPTFIYYYKKKENNSNKEQVIYLKRTNI